MLEKLEDQLEEVRVGTAAARVAAHLHDFDGARRIARIVAEKSGYSTDWRAGGRLLMAEFSFASGRFEEAFADVDTAGRLESQWTRELGGLFALPGFVELTPERLNGIRDDIEAWSARDSLPSGAFFFGAHGYVHRHVRLYLLGMLDIRLGELERADSIWLELRRSFGGRHGESLKNALETSLSAHLLRARGQVETALTRLETIAPELHAWMEQVGFSPFYSRAYDRLVMAELYREKEEYAEALRWYRSLTEGYEGLFVAPAHYRIAEILRLQGRAAEAQVHTDEFDRLWSTADPAARRRLSSARW
jgi:tetratricopeptide (TPR) repeat protein